ncbi:MAG: hypothetical protein L6R41_008057 [Letrouitia leprolyta]|nr:MAG: hypothetical protein L6R41_008057 [Letrouitia leprolyta]
MYTLHQTQQKPNTPIITMASTIESPLSNPLETNHIIPPANKTPNLPRRSPRSLQRTPYLFLPRLLLSTQITSTNPT